MNMMPCIWIIARAIDPQTMESEDLLKSPAIKTFSNITMASGEKIQPGPDTRSRGNIVAIQSANQSNGLEITHKTAIPEWYGDRMDPEMAVDMLLVCE